tara:strand:- start:3043 stop:3273 length:231 start_codon:yes stop_codon:yes gene_type:complete
LKGGIYKMNKIILIILLGLTLTACANKKVLVGKKCTIDDDVAGYTNTKTVTKSWIWFVETDTDWSDQINKENCLDG